MTRGEIHVGSQFILKDSKEQKRGWGYKVERVVCESITREVIHDVRDKVILYPKHGR